MSEFTPIALPEASHDRGPFDCGVAPLNVYLKQDALHNQQKGIVRNYVTCRGTCVVGYYSLAYGSAAQADAPPALTRGIGKYPIPLMILARLAVDVRETGQGLGKALLKDAILRTLQAADIAGLKAIFVQAKDQDAERFYAMHGFIPSPGDPFHLFFPLDPLRK
jgi:GNAT superfamily N-acetyltransferase